MNKKKIVLKQNKMLFCKLSLKLNNKLNTFVTNKNNQLMLKNELKTYTTLLVLDELEKFVTILSKKTIDKKKLKTKIDYILLIIFINSGISLNNAFPKLFPKIIYSLTESKWLLNFLLTSEEYFVKELFYYLLFAKKQKKNCIKTRTFSLILENINLKIADTLVYLYLFQKNYSYQIFQDQTSNSIYLNSTIRNFQTNLYYHLYFKEALLKVKNIHKNIYPISILINNKIQKKQIFYPRFEERNKLSIWQSFVLFYLEIADFIKLKYFQKQKPSLKIN